MVNLNNIGIFRTLMNLTGINDPWIIVSAFFCLLFVIFFIATICNVAKKRSARKRIAELEETAKGLKALTNLPPLKIPNDGEYTDSLVFSSSRDLKRASAPAKPKSKPDESPIEAENVTQAVHSAILASVTGSHKALNEEDKRSLESATRSDLSGRIPHV